MKLIYLHQYFKTPAETGGTRSYDLATSFVNMGYNVEVVSSTSDKSYRSRKRWTTTEKDGLILHYIYLPYGNQLSYFQRVLVFFKFIWYACFKLLSMKGDVVLATSTPLTIGIPALMKRKIQKTPYIFEVRDVWPEAVIAIGAIKNRVIQKVLFFLEKLIYNNASAIVPLSVDMKKSIVSRYPKISNKKPVKVIENIAEINRFQQTAGTDTSLIINALGYKPRFSVLYAGTFGRVNGIDYVIGLAEKTLSIDDSLVYILIGKGRYIENVRRVAEEKNVLNQNVFILDPVSKQDLPQWYREVSMGSSFVIPIKELWANSANKFFDTLAAGRPILINYSGWQKDIIQKENVGYVLSEDITDRSAKNFVEYTRNKEMVETQKFNAIKLAKERYSLEVAVKKYTDIFDDIKIQEDSI